MLFFCCAAIVCFYRDAFFWSFTIVLYFHELLLISKR
jgi:hypothetical protein